MWKELQMKSNAIKISEDDNVVIATQPIGKGDDVVVNGQRLLEVADNIQAGHKIALVPLDAGQNVIRYGEPIVQATRAIAKSEWVHVHNTRPVPGDLDS
jgi:altronate hydrolase